MITDHGTRPEDVDKIVDVKAVWSLRFRTREPGVTERELSETVEAVGPLGSDVKRILARCIAARPLPIAVSQRSEEC